MSVTVTTQICDFCSTENGWYDFINKTMKEKDPRWGSSIPANDPIWDEYRKVIEFYATKCIEIVSNDGSIASVICKSHLIKLSERL